MKEKLEILVVEDTQKHIESAKETLRDHNATIVSTYMGAIESLRNSVTNGNIYDVLMTDLFIPWNTEKLKRAFAGWL